MDKNAVARHADLFADIGYGELGRRKQRFGIIDALFYDEFFDRHAAEFFKYLIQRIFRYKKMGTDRLHGERGRKIFIDELFNFKE